MSKIVSLFCVLFLSGCSNQPEYIEAAKNKYQEAIYGPQLTSIQNPAGGQDKIEMPQTKENKAGGASLWPKNAKTFFKDGRASGIGDVLRVSLTLNDSAKLENKTETERETTEKANLNRMMGLEKMAAGVFRKGGAAAVNSPAIAGVAAATSNLLDMSSKPVFKGEGDIDRSEKVKIKVSVMVIDKLENGNLVIHGNQEMKVNGEIRVLDVTGVIQRNDIAADNTINAERIAEARISYGGKGILSKVQRPRYGSRIVDALSPF